MHWISIRIWMRFSGFSNASQNETILFAMLPLKVAQLELNACRVSQSTFVKLSLKCTASTCYDVCVCDIHCGNWWFNDSCNEMVTEFFVSCFPTKTKCKFSTHHRMSVPSIKPHTIRWNMMRYVNWNRTKRVALKNWFGEWTAEKKGKKNEAHRFQKDLQLIIRSELALKPKHCFRILGESNDVFASRIPIPSII